MVKLFTDRSRLVSERIGSVLVIHERKSDVRADFDLLAELGVQPGHTVVAVDVDAGSDLSRFTTVLDDLRDREGTLLLAPGWIGCGDTAPLAAWLAPKLGRPVIGHEGRPCVIAGGGLFVPDHAGAGWIQLTPDGRRIGRARRLPAPAWECPAVNMPGAVEPGQWVEPIPAGVWIRPDGDPRAVTVHRRRLVESLAPDPRFPRVVVGRPGAPLAEPATVARYLRTLPEGLRAGVRFALFGAERNPSGWSRALATAAGSPVVTGAGVRFSAAKEGQGPATRVLLAGRPMAWHPLLTELRHRPAATDRGGRPRGPEAVEPVRPIADLPEVAPGVYRYADGVVLEVVASGLYMRPAAEPPSAAAVRALPADPERGALIFEDVNAEVERSMVNHAAEAMGRLEPELRSAIRLVQARKALARVGVAVRPAASPRPVPVRPDPPRPDPPRQRPASAALPTAGGDAVPGIASEAFDARVRLPSISRLQPVPRSQAAALFGPNDTLRRERTWLREHLGARHQEVAERIAPLLGPLLGESAKAQADYSDRVSDLVAARLYLEGEAGGLTSEVRLARVGAHVPFARCANAGLSLLPTWPNQAVVIGAELDEDAWRTYEAADEITEWAFCQASPAGTSTSQSAVAIAILTHSAVRSDRLLPDEPPFAIFRPGTRFTVLSTDRPARRVLLRELPRSAGAQDQAETIGATAATVALAAAADAYQSAAAHGVRPHSGPRAVRFSDPPGLLTSPVPGAPVAARP